MSKKLTVRTAVGLVMVAGVVAPTAVAVSGQANAAAIECSATRGSSDDYPGPSASAVYDRKFDATSHKVPYLSHHTPQGLDVWTNWDGTGRDLTLITSYRDGSDAYIMGLDRATGRHIGTVRIADSHVGGIAVSNGWAFVSGRSSTIRKYRLSTLRTKMKEAGIPYLTQTGIARNVYGASFIAAHDGHLFAGRFEENSRGKMYRYRINSDGSLTTLSGSWEIPKKTQGLLVTKNHFIYSTSFKRTNRSNIYVVRRGERDLDKARLKCFRAPTMAEGITAARGSAYLVFESGSYAFPGAVNKISTLHRAPLSSLTGMVP